MGHIDIFKKAMIVGVVEAIIIAILITLYPLLAANIIVIGFLAGVGTELFLRYNPF